MSTTAAPFVPALGDVVSYNGERGEVVGFGSLAAAFPEFDQCVAPSAFVVRVEMGRYRTRRTLGVEQLRVAS